MEYQTLISTIETVNAKLLLLTAHKINQYLTLRNWSIGHCIVEYEQNGKDRARYGDELLVRLSQDLTRNLGKGFSQRYLELFRKFFLRYRLSSEILDKLIHSEEENIVAPPLSQKSHPTRNLQDEQYIITLFTSLTWSHFIELIQIEDDLKRAFYEIECLKNKWSVREFMRQKNSLLFERVGLSKNKEKVMQMSMQGAIVEKPADIIKTPFVFEFLGLKEELEFTENNLETALIDHLQEFLFEMGRGFCFVARQKRISFDNNHYYIDLVLYNRLLKAIVLIDLKTQDFQPEYAGQMNFYLNYFKANEAIAGENDPIGIVLCSGKKRTLVEYAFGSMANNIFAGEYRLALPSPEELEREIAAYREKFLFQQEHLQVIKGDNKETHLLPSQISEKESIRRFVYPQDFDHKSFYKFLQQASIIPDFAPENILFSLRIAHKHGKIIDFTKEGILFFGKKPGDFLPSAGIHCRIYEGLAKNTIIEQQEFKESLLANLQNSLAYLKTKLCHITGPTTTEQLEIPEEVLWEALINMVFHRDYQSNKPALIEIFSDRLVFSNPGGLLPVFAKEDFGKISIARNPLIGQLLMRLGYVRQLASGIVKMKALASENSPTFDWTSQYFEATFLREALPNISIELLKKEGIEIHLLSTARKKRCLALVNYLVKNSTIRIPEYTDIMQVSHSTAYKDLLQFRQMKLLCFVGSKKTGHYELVLNCKNK